MKRSKQPTAPRTGFSHKYLSPGGRGTGEGGIFLPSPRQMQFAFYYFAFPYFAARALGAGRVPRLPTIQAVCDAIGIHRCTAYRWLKDPGFRRWWEMQYHAALPAIVPEFTAALLASAEAGNDGALSAFFKFLRPSYMTDILNGGLPKFDESAFDRITPEEWDRMDADYEKMLAAPKE